MAKYRQVHITFWQDPFIEDLEPLERYFYLYLMTNSKTTQCGCYEISMKLIKYETGLKQNQIDQFIQLFRKKGKIEFNQEHSEFILINWLKHNSFRSPKVRTCIEKELINIKTKEFKEYIYYILKEEHPIYSLSIDYPKSKDSGSQQEQEQEEEQKQEQTIYREIVDYLNFSCSTNYKHTTQKTKDLIKARMNEGFSFDDFKTVISVKAKEWLNTEQSKYLRPETLFGTKFEGYLNQKKEIEKPTHENLMGALPSAAPTKRRANRLGG